MGEAFQRAWGRAPEGSSQRRVVDLSLRVIVRRGARERVAAHELEGENASVAREENHDSAFGGLSRSTTDPPYSSMRGRHCMWPNKCKSYETELNHRWGVGRRRGEGLRPSGDWNALMTQRPAKNANSHDHCHFLRPRRRRGNRTPSVRLSSALPHFSGRRQTNRLILASGVRRPPARNRPSLLVGQFRQRNAPAQSSRREARGLRTHPPILRLRDFTGACEVKVSRSPIQCPRVSVRNSPSWLISCSNALGTFERGR